MKAKGFTLIELVLVITIVGVISMAAANSLSGLTRNYETGKAISELATLANIAMDNLRRDIGNAKSFSQLSSSQIKFNNQSDNSVTYQYRSSQQDIRRSETSLGTKTFATNISSLAFSYADKDFATTSQSDELRVVTIELTLSQNALSYSLIANAEIRATA